MADIFISYAKKDRSRIIPLAEGLKKQGWSVFWDRNIPGGKTWDEVIEEELESAKCVIVVWSKISKSSRWVRAEAEEGLKRNILIPVSIEDTKIPLLFRPVQAVRLINWDKDSNNPQFKKLISDLSSILGPSPLEIKKAEEKGAEQSPPENAKKMEKRKAEHPFPEPTGEGPPVGEETPLKNDKGRSDKRIPVSVFVIATLLVCIVASLLFFFTPKGEDRYEKELAKSIGMNFVLISTGDFTMVSPVSKKGRGNGETQHTDTITQPFYIQTTEVTQEQWQTVMGDNPSHFKNCDDCPVERVSWKDVQDFVAKMNEKEGVTYYRLPMEAEWEYAAWAGSITAFSFGDDEKALGEYAWYDKNSNGRTHPVGTKKPNAWGLYDMHGNVWERVAGLKADYSAGSVTDPEDRQSGNDGGVRGGSWRHGAKDCRLANRSVYWAGHRNSFIGFRLAKSDTLDP